MKKILFLFAVAAGIAGFGAVHAMHEGGKPETARAWDDFVKSAKGYYEHYVKGPVEQWPVADRIEFADRLNRIMQEKNRQQEFQKYFSQHIASIYETALQEKALTEQGGKTLAGLAKNLNVKPEDVLSAFVEKAINVESPENIATFLKNAQALDINEGSVVDALAERAREKVWSLKIFERLPEKLQPILVGAIAQKAVTAVRGRFEDFYDFAQRIGQEDAFFGNTIPRIIEKTNWDSKKVNNVIKNEKLRKNVIDRINKVLSAEIAGLDKAAPEAIETVYERAKRFDRKTDFMDRLYEILPQKKTGEMPSEVLDDLKAETRIRVIKLDIAENLTPQKLNNLLNAALQLGLSKYVIEDLSTVMKVSKSFERTAGEPGGLDALKDIAAREVIAFIRSMPKKDLSTSYFKQLMTVIKNFNLTDLVVEEISTKLSPTDLEKVKEIESPGIRNGLLAMINDYIAKQAKAGLQGEKLEALGKLADQFGRINDVLDPLIDLALRGAQASSEGKLTVQMLEQAVPEKLRAAAFNRITERAFKDPEWGAKFLNNIMSGIHSKIFENLQVLINAGIKKTGAVPVDLKNRIDAFYKALGTTTFSGDFATVLSDIAFDRGWDVKKIEQMTGDKALHTLIVEKINEKINDEIAVMASLSSDEITRVFVSAQVFGRIDEAVNAVLKTIWDLKTLTAKVTDEDARKALIENINTRIGQDLKKIETMSSADLSQLIDYARRFEQLKKVEKVLIDATVTNVWDAKTLKDKLTDLKIGVFNKEVYDNIVESIKKEISDFIVNFKSMSELQNLREFLMVVKNFGGIGEKGGIEVFSEKLKELKNDQDFISSFEKILKVLSEDKEKKIDEAGKLKGAVLDKLAAIAKDNPTQRARILKNPDVSLQDILKNLTDKEAEQLGSEALEDGALKRKAENFVNNFTPKNIPSYFETWSREELTRSLVFAEGMGEPYQEKLLKATVDFAWENGPEPLGKITDDFWRKRVNDEIDKRFKQNIKAVSEGKIDSESIPELLAAAQNFNRNDEVFKIFAEAVENNKQDVAAIARLPETHEEYAVYINKLEDYILGGWFERLNKLMDPQGADFIVPDTYGRLSSAQLKELKAQIKEAAKMLLRFEKLGRIPATSDEFYKAYNLIKNADTAAKRREAVLKWEEGGWFWQNMIVPLIRFTQSDFLKSLFSYPIKGISMNVQADAKKRAEQIPVYWQNKEPKSTVQASEESPFERKSRTLEL